MYGIEQCIYLYVKIIDKKKEKKTSVTNYIFAQKIVY
jgi:hypothetical protein